jgi:hypothetical protein
MLAMLYTRLRRILSYIQLKKLTPQLTRNTVACKTGFPSSLAAGNFISLLDQGSQPHLTNLVKRWLLNRDALHVQIASK